MFGRSKTQAVMDHAATSKDFALALSRDKKFRKQLLSAIGHGAKAKRRAIAASAASAADLTPPAPAPVEGWTITLGVGPAVFTSFPGAKKRLDLADRLYFLSPSWRARAVCFAGRWT